MFTIKKLKFNYKRVSRIVYWLVICVLGLIVLSVIISSVNIPGGLKIYSVQSGSMEPSIYTGSIVISVPTDNYQLRDIITFKAEKDRLDNNPKYITTHRIYEIKVIDGQENYITKGDANNTPDIVPTSKDLVLGKTIFSIPLLGYLVAFAKTREGLIFLVIIPATIIIYSELISIKNEAKKLLEERKKRKLTLAEKIEVEIGEEEIKAEKWYKRFIKKCRLFFKGKPK